MTTYFNGGPNKVETASAPTVNNATGDVTLAWSGVEGGTYLVEASDDLVIWPDLAPTVTATDDQASFIESGARNSHSKRFYRVSRKSLASFDSKGFDYTVAGTGGGGTTATVPGGVVTRGNTCTLTIPIPTNSTPPVPPANVAVTRVGIGGSTAGVSALVHTSQYVVTCTYTVPTGTTGAKNVVVTFPGPSTIYTLTGGLTVN